MKISIRKISVLVMIALFAFSGAQAFCEQLFKLGVVDMTRVVNAYYKDSQYIRDLQKYWSETETNLDKINQEIKDLEEKKLKAQQEGKSSDVLQYERAISDKKTYQNEYYRQRRIEYERMYDNVTKSSEFFNQLLAAIKFISIRDSYSMVLKSTDQSIMYFSPDVDITNDVIEYLKK